MKKVVLDKWCTPQGEAVKHYCHACGICISEKQIQNSEGEQHFCSTHKGLNSSNVILMDERLFKTVFKTIEKILQKYNSNKLTIQVSRDGIWFRYMDPSHVSLTEIHLYVKAFKILKIDFPSPKTFTINLDELKKILRKIERNEVLIRFNEDNIQLSFLGSDCDCNKNILKKSYSLELIDIPIEDITEPDLEFHVEVKIKTNAFTQILKKIKQLADYKNTYFECTSNCFQIYAYDDADNIISESFSKSELIKIWTEIKVSTIYNSDYIFTLIDGLKRYVHIIQIQYSHCLPLLITANLSKLSLMEDYNNYLGHLKFYLANRISGV